MLRLPSDSSCVRFTRATVRFLPPPGAVFGVLRVTVDGAEATRMTGVPRAASATIRLSGRRTEVRASGTTLGGQVIGASRNYRRCGATPKPKQKTQSRAEAASPRPCRSRSAEATTASRSAVQVRWFGQSAFALTGAEGAVFIDPFADVSPLIARGMQFD